MPYGVEPRAESIVLQSAQGAKPCLNTCNAAFVITSPVTRHLNSSIITKVALHKRLGVMVDVHNLRRSLSLLLVFRLVSLYRPYISFTLRRGANCGRLLLLFGAPRGSLHCSRRRSSLGRKAAAFLRQASPQQMQHNAAAKAY